MTDPSEAFETALLALDRVGARTILEGVLDGGSPIQRIETVVVPALERIGKAWETGELSLAQVYMAGRLCEDAVGAITSTDHPARPNAPRTAVAVLDDYHFLGKRMVYAVLRSGGYSPLDYGRVTVDELVARVNEDRIDVVFISTLMYPSALRVKEVCAKLTGTPVRVVVGGAPFRCDPELWKDVGAHDCGSSASDVLRMLSAWETP
jgi:methanogenic corrinoid protein MtbC1